MINPPPPSLQAMKINKSEQSNRPGGRLTPKQATTLLKRFPNQTSEIWQTMRRRSKSYRLIDFWRSDWQWLTNMTIVRQDFLNWVGYKHTTLGLVHCVQAKFTISRPKLIQFFLMLSDVAASVTTVALLKYNARDSRCVILFDFQASKPVSFWMPEKNLSDDVIKWPNEVILQSSSTV